MEGSPPGQVTSAVFSPYFMMRRLLDAFGPEPSDNYHVGSAVGDIYERVELVVRSCTHIHTLREKLEEWQEWQRAYTLYRARSVREASLVVANASAPVDAAPMYLVDRIISGLTTPTVHVSPHQQREQPCDGVSEEGHAEVGPVAVGGVVTVYAVEELNGEVFVELMELVGITRVGSRDGDYKGNGCPTDGPRRMLDPQVRAELLNFLTEVWDKFGNLNVLKEELAAAKERSPDEDVLTTYLHEVWPRPQRSTLTAEEYAAGVEAVCQLLDNLQSRLDHTCTQLVAELQATGDETV